MSDPRERLRAPERLRVVETYISEKVAELRRWLEVDLAHERRPAT